MTQFIGLCVGGSADGQVLASHDMRLIVDCRGKRSPFVEPIEQRPAYETKPSYEMYRRVQCSELSLWVVETMTDDQALHQIATHYHNTRRDRT